MASLAGIAGFTLLCFLHQPPWVWFLVAGGFSVLVFWRNAAARKALGITFLICTCLLAIPDHRNASTYWSPYQKLSIRPVYNNAQLEAYSLATNDSLYQTIVNLSPEFVQSHTATFQRHPLNQNSYNMPYRFYPAPPWVLVLGSGMGNGVAAELRNGAGRVEAVEIDPLILKLGRDVHFEHPYQSPLVQVTLDDARSYIENCHAATLALCTPVFFVGIIFVSSFARTGFRGSALGSNLFGSLIGGLLESSSLWFGLKSLTVLAAILYLGSAFFLRRSQTTAERAPIPESVAAE